MQPVIRRLAAVVLFVGLACSQVEAGGGRFTVNPTLVAFSHEASSVLVSLANESEESMRFQLSVFAWDQAPDGEMKLGPTEDIVFFPQMLALAPGESRNIRVAALVPPEAAERSYRLFIEELPSSQAERKPGAVQMLTRVGIPIFIAAHAAVEAAELRDLSREGQALSFSLANIGTTHFVPEAISVKALGHDGTVLGERTVTAWYVLAGGLRTFTTDLPGLAASNAAEVVVEARYAGKTVTRRLDLATRVSR